MKNTFIWVLVVVLIVLGVLFLGKGKQLEAPVDNGITNTMPAPGATGVNEMIVEEGGEVKEFTVTGTNFAFEPSMISVKKGDRVKITFKNTQGFHDFVIDEFSAATKQMQSPGTEVLEFVADKTGTFEYYCSVGSHRQMGMKGTLKVE